MVLLGLLGAFHIYMRHTSGERQLSSLLLILHANIKCDDDDDDDDVMFLGNKPEDQKVRMRRFKSTT